MGEWSNEPLDGFERWDSYPDYPVEEWKKDVAEDNTRFGYWAWVKDCLYWDDFTDITLGYRNNTKSE